MMGPLQSTSAMPPTPTHTVEPRRQRKDFEFRHGHKLHTYDKAPYPLSYNRLVLELESLDNALIRYLKGSVSFVPFTTPPKRVLDLGCGTGTWIIEAAKQWPECHFVGLDLVNIQLDLKYLPHSISSRIEFRYGNFLTNSFPFEEDEFDHVHVQSIAKAVPESKWGILFEKIHRILKPGGSIEVIDDDITFPRLPKWFTTALRNRPLRPKGPPGFESVDPLQPTNSPRGRTLAHDHELLETLYLSVFERRFINLRPCAILPSYINTTFRRVSNGPIVNFPMPPLPPLPPLPPQATPSYIPDGLADLLESRTPTSPSSPTMSATRPLSLSFSSTSSGAFVALSDLDSMRTPSTSQDILESSLSRRPSFGDPTLPLDLATMALYASDGETLACKNVVGLSDAQLSKLSDRALAMNLYRSYQTVMACQEAMWEELKFRIRNDLESLVELGWNDDEELEEMHSREKFEKYIERYRSDMLARISLWCSLESLGIPAPIREPLSKAALIEEEQRRERMMEARKQATTADFQAVCRSVRTVIGYKGGTMSA